MSISVRELSPCSEPAWEAYVAHHPQGTLFHTLVWRDAVEDAFGHRSRYLCAWRDEALTGVFPLTELRSCFSGRLLVSVPYAVYGGALVDDDESKTALLEHAQELAEQVNAQWIDIRSVEPQWRDLPVVRRYVTFRKQLPSNKEQVLAELPRKSRAAARQARERHGLEAVFDDDHLDAVWSLYSRSMRRLASVNYPSRFFSTLIERTGAVDSGAAVRHIVQLVLHQGQPVAGLISFIYRGTLMPYFAGCDEGCQDMHSNNFLYLAAMEYGVEIGCREFDFGRSRIDNAGSYDFKRFQGFNPTPLHYQYYVPNGGRVPDLHPGNSRLALARRVWPRLPLAVTRPLGAWLSKSIPG